MLVCCESYKFHERVQLDSITHNELLDQRLLATVGGCGGGVCGGWWCGGMGWGRRARGLRFAVIEQGDPCCACSLKSCRLQFWNGFLAVHTVLAVRPCPLRVEPVPLLPLVQVPDRADVPAMPGWQAKGGAPPAPVTPDDKEKRVHLLVGWQMESSSYVVQRNLNRAWPPAGAGLPPCPLPPPLPCEPAPQLPAATHLPLHTAAEPGIRPDPG